SELDLFVCQEVCRSIAERKQLQRKTVPVSINVSRVGLLTQGFLDDFTNILSQNNVSTQEIRMEITESAFVRTDEVEKQLESVHHAGIPILMDDFGSGYSNFNTFASMPVDILKVDIGFMSNLENTVRGHGVVSTIVDMARKLSMPIVVEGVEEESQVESLKEMGVHFVQGFYYARPMPLEDFEQLLVSETEQAGGGCQSEAASRPLSLSSPGL
ncbi:MAG: EAL domain-containing protein, partial [Atopobiaceae bacterium]|nr:EAL domain-containing protein [Atopobiaceae bacterium]